MSITIRSATAADGDAMLALMPRLAAFDLPNGRNPDHLWMHDADLLREWIAGRAAHCRVQVAHDGDRVVGLALAALGPEPLSKAPSAHLEAIAVAPGQEGKGIGGMLLKAIERDVLDAGAQSMTLHVFAVNTRARALYEKAGYDGEMMRYIKPLAGDAGED